MKIIVIIIMNDDDDYDTSCLNFEEKVISLKQL